MSRRRQLAAGTLLGAVSASAVLLDSWLVAAAILGVAVTALATADDRVAAVPWAAAAFTAPFNGIRVSSFFALSDVFLVAAVVTMIPSVALGRRRSDASPHRRLLLGVAAIAAGGLIGTLFADRPEASLVQLSKFVLATGASIAAFSLWAPRRRQIRWFCAWWLAGATVSAVWALTFSPRIVGRPLGLTSHPNHLGLACVLGAGMALGFARSGRSLSRWAAIASCLLLVLGLMASGSRAAVLGLVTVVPAVALLASRLQLAVRAAIVGAAFAWAVLLGWAHVPADTSLGRLFGDPTAVQSDAERIDHLSQSIDRVQEHPLTGEGFEFAHEAHVIYLQVLVAAGPLGLIGLVVVIRSVLRDVRRGMRTGSGPVRGDRALLAGLGGGYAGYLVIGAFQNILWDRYLWLYAVAAVALAAELRSSRAAFFTRPLDRGTGPPLFRAGHG